MEHGQGAIRIFVDSDRDLHIMEPVPVGRELQTFALIPHGIVVGHDTVLLHTEHIDEVRPDLRDEGGVGFCR